MKKNYLSGVVCCLIATVSWGGMFPVMTSALSVLDPFSLTAMRYMIAGVAFVGMLLIKEGGAALSLKGERWGLAWLLGSLGFAGFGFLVFLGQKLAGPDGALTASIVMATMPMMGILVGWVLHGVRPALPTVGFILLSLAGMVLVIIRGDVMALFSANSLAACLPLLLGALAWVIYTVGAGYFPHWSAYRYTTLTTLLGLTSILAINGVLMWTGVSALPTLSQVTAVAPHLLYMALVAGFVGVLCWNVGNRIITPLNGVLFMDVVPVTAFAISAMTGVMASRVQLMGATLTAVALVFNNLYQRQQRLMFKPTNAALPAR
jgi:drug/metabolite transporter (DMT)-like permease